MHSAIFLFSLLATISWTSISSVYKKERHIIMAYRVRISIYAHAHAENMNALQLLLYSEAQLPVPNYLDSL